jgi:hypothetical protein
VPNVNVRLSPEEAAAARAQAEQEEQRAGIPVSMSAVIRRAIRRDLLEAHRTAGERQGLEAA